MVFMKTVTHVTGSITPILMAKGKYRGSNGNNKALLSTNGSFKNSEIFTTEFEINETPPSARTLLTKGYIQDEINNFSGATVSTRGRFMTEADKSRSPAERPLYLYIQGHSKHNIDLAIQKIHEIIKTEHQSSLSRPSRFTNAPPPLMSLHSGTPSVEKICVGIENAPQGFDLRGRIVGAGGANLLYIRGETGANVSLRGRGSQFMDPVLGGESPEPLHLYIEHSKPEALQNAKQLAINLIQTMQSELQAYIQQQPPPVQSQQVIETSQLQQIQQAHFQTMNIGALGQSNVVTIQHQDIIQHPQSSVVTLPATILTATMAGAPGAGVPPPGVHIPAHAGPLVPPTQAQDLQTLIPPPPVGQVQLIAPPPTVSQVQYQIHSGQPLHIQVPPSSHSSTQPVAQMYVMSQPPPASPGHSGFISSSSGSVSGAVSYVYTQPNMPRPSTPCQTGIETVNVNLQQPPPSAPLNITHQPPPPLLHLHFPPPNFPPNQPPPPVPQTYQIQYQQVQTSGQQFVLQPEQIVPSVQQNPDQHLIQPQFDERPGHYPIQMPPPATQTFLVPNSQSPHHLPAGAPLPIHEGPHHHESGLEQGPQPVPPPQMVPPPNQIGSSMNVLTSVPPPNQQGGSQNAPWLYAGQQPQGQMQVQMPPPQGLHNVPPGQIHYTQQLHYQNGQMPEQLHYTVQPPQQPFEMHNPDSPEQQKGHGVKRRFNDVEGPQEPPPYHNAPLPIHRHGNGDGERLLPHGHGPPPGGVGPLYGERNKPPMPPTHPGEKLNMEQKPSGVMHGSDSNFDGECGQLPPPVQGPPHPAPWQGHDGRMSWIRPPPPPPPTNMPPPQIRPSRGQSDGDQNRLSIQSTMEHHVNIEYNQIPPYAGKPPPYNSLPLMHSICNPPPPPPPPPPHHHQQRPQYPQQYQVPVSQGYQPPVSCPPWMNS
ncbi:extensin isoform X2 [Diachasma alloeum]|uniref:extensin isoform X2 n=1 Tax=Diachasma alloeum TaxID=454923 RepID=UPI0007381EDC|nr:extensin isoform X2 [Diachasma alloeum]